MSLNKPEKAEEIRKLTNQKVLENRISEESLEGNYVFVSFDLVDSTRYKSIETDWSILIQKFYEGTYHYVKSEVNENFKVWKYIGDEILLFLKINNIDELIEIPPNLYKVMNIVQSVLEDSFPNSKGLIYLKGTVFIAKVDEIKEYNNKNRNYIIKTQANDFSSNSKLVIRDFLGPDIDLGFRLTKHSYKNQLVVSLEMVYLIEQYISKSNSYKSDLNDNFRVMKLITLKGIWHNRKYPIIWFKPEKENWELKNLIEYDDDLFQNKEFNYYLNNYIEENNYLNLSEFIKKVLVQSGKINVIEEIEEIFNIHSENNEKTPDAYQLNTLVPTDRMTEVHYVLIGINISDNTVAIFTKNKNNEEIYDFGCAHSNEYEPVIDIINNYYKSLYKGMNILKRNENDNMPLPVSMYQYDKHEKKVSGFMFVALISDITGEIPKGYTNVRMEKIENCRGKEFYDDSELNLKLALESLSNSYLNKK
ncbi:hypothetical protein FGY92_09940 [Staphylococcus hominis]|uniref:hypothetical protein n=1 Tax=Staphylococcus hominis TaxID=1290 RepID=UPI001F3815C1|nr:hypothetical protein [Staphylococcus hominis]UJB23913.1 hypothetical protein FGY92_09940 [Staphylococcus hominis]